jgi:predicted RNase H-like nuclease (RuvC/YqgF family)
MNHAQCTCSSDNQRYSEIMADIVQLQNNVDVINRTHIADINDVTAARAQQQTKIDDVTVTLNKTHVVLLSMLVTMQSDAQKQQDKYNDDMRKLIDQQTHDIQSQTSVIQQLENHIHSLEDKCQNLTKINQDLQSRNIQQDLRFQNLTTINQELKSRNAQQDLDLLSLQHNRDADIQQLQQLSIDVHNMTRVTGTYTTCNTGH